MKIDTSEWKDFYAGELFSSIYKVASYCDEELTRGSAYDEGAIAYVTRTDQDNGVKSLVRGASLTNVESGNAIVIGDTTSTISYQPSPFVAGEHIIAARADWLNKNTGLFITCLMRQERYRYSYGRAYKLDLVRNTKLKLPVTTDGKPDWHWIESYVDSLRSKPLTTGNDSKNGTFNLDISTWKTFLYSEIFDIRKGFYNKKPDHTELGNIPFLGATAGNNGVTEYYTYNEIATATKTGDVPNSPIEQKLFPPNAVCVTNNGSVGYAYFQPTRFTCSHDVNPLYRKDGEFNALTGQFVATVIMHDRYRWDYGRKWRPVRMVNSTIKLPATPEGKPDWQFMENYIKSLPYGDRL